ncbi:hypothetical protein [Chryseobacterium sp. 5_R23647]|uniref:hypothetical protein n=1 Tax=Chryseobacterium sp. 5_R23647 TaxID=2258964 RepID=UPI000E2446BA|nr:hypothetical protein [Chryseobacterium sp. 5_R23647]REC40516.1 hypothetical protein DRF69_18655 [Chryseobacterium sp. 5_R23647]
MDSDYKKVVIITAIIAGAIFLITSLILNNILSPKEKKYYELILSNGKVIKDSLKDYEDRFEADSISYYKNQIISTKEIK